MSADAAPSHEPSAGQRVPWRTIFAVLAVVVAAYVTSLIVAALSRVLVLLVTAGFFAVVLSPAVDLLQRRLRLPRAAAGLVVYVLVVGLFIAMLAAFITPVVTRSQQFAEDLPGYLRDAERGRGAVGNLVERFQLDNVIRRNQAEIQDTLRNLATPALGLLGKAFGFVANLLTVLVVSFLMVLQGPGLTAGTLAIVPDRQRERVRKVAADSARAVSGYMFGNLLISVVAGLASWVALHLAGVPYPEVLALWVAFTDLLPLIGATLGAVPTVGLAFLHSTPAGIGMAIYFIIYQQFENNVLQVTVMSRTVDVNPLMVLVSVLCGVELLGLLGGLLAIPAAGVIQVMARDLWEMRDGRLKPVPTVGADELPLSAGDPP